MSVERLLVFILALLSVLLGCRPAHAARVAQYEVQIDLRADNDRAVYRLRLAYEPDAGESKTDGFKFLGDQEIRSLRLIEPLGAKVQNTGWYRESRVDFEFALDEKGRPAPIVFDYVQALPDRRYRWDGFEHSLPWLHVFETPVDEMTVVLLVPSSWVLDGHACVDEGNHQRCTRKTKGAAPVELFVHDDQTRTTSILAALASGGFVVLFFSLAHGFARRRWARRIGYVPVPSLVQPPILQTSYRAPAPLPVDADLEPKLAEEDERRFSKRYWTTIAVSTLALVAIPLLAHGRITIPLAAMLVCMGVATVLLTYYVMVQESGRTWALTLLTIPIGFIVGGPLSYVAFAVPAVAGFVHLVMTQHQRSGSASSCGAGFSACGGGGGCGGGCGGCGGCGG